MTRARRHVSATDAAAMDRTNAWAKQRRARNRAAGDCINETTEGTHGKATHGVRCAHCYEVHRGGRVDVPISADLASKLRRRASRGSANQLADNLINRALDAAEGN